MKKLLSALLMLIAFAFPATKLNIAITYFKANDGVEEAMARNASILLESALNDTRKFTIVDRAALDKILNEQKLQQGGCTDQECAVKLGNILNVQRMVIGEIIKIGSTYTLVVKFLDVELGSLDEEVGTVEQDFVGDTGLKDAIKQLAKVVEQRIATQGKIVAITDGEVLCNLGSTDGILPGQEVKIQRLGEAIIDEDTGELISRKKLDVGFAVCEKIETKASYLILTKEGKKLSDKAGGLKKGDVVIVVVSEKVRKDQADKYFNQAKALFDKDLHQEALSEVDKALKLFPQSGSYLDLKNDIQNKISASNVKNAERDAKRRQSEDEAERKANRKSRSSYNESGSSSRTYSRRSRGSYSGGSGKGVLVVSYTSFDPKSTKVKTLQQMNKIFPKYPKVPSGIDIGIEVLQKNMFVYFHGDIFFFKNSVDKAALPAVYKTDSWTHKFYMWDVRFGYGVGGGTGRFMGYAAWGMLYKNTIAWSKHDSWDSAAKINNWGLGVEALLGFRIGLGGGLSLNGQWVRQATAILNQSPNYTSGTGTSRSARMNVSGRQLTMGLGISF